MTLWLTESLLVHVTFWPTLAVASFGENAMFFMSIATAPSAAGGAAAEVGLVPPPALEFEWEDEDELPQPAMAIAAVRARGRVRRIMRRTVAAYFVTVTVACMPGWNVHT